MLNLKSFSGLLHLEECLQVATGEMIKRLLPSNIPFVFLLPEAIVAVREVRKANIRNFISHSKLQVCILALTAINFDLC